MHGLLGTAIDKIPMATKIAGRAYLVALSEEKNSLSGILKKNWAISLMLSKLVLVKRLTPKKNWVLQLVE